MPKLYTDTPAQDREESTYIRALLAKTRPLSGSEIPDVYWEGRSLIECLALAFELADDDYHWDAINCATVLKFIGVIEPITGHCFCNDRSNSEVNATCGFHVILDFMAAELRRVVPQPRSRKRGEAAHG
jgi:hypothetical protein